MENPKGGTLYIRAAAKVGEKNWSPTARKDLTFVKAVGKEAFEVNGSKYGTWKEAVSALEEAGSGEIILGDDVELQEKDTFPSVSCTIRSGNERKCKIKGGVMEARADITFENVVYDVNRIYGNGHSVTIGADVETPFSFTKRAILRELHMTQRRKKSRQTLCFLWKAASLPSMAAAAAAPPSRVMWKSRSKAPQTWKLSARI